VWLPASLGYGAAGDRTGAQRMERMAFRAQTIVVDVLIAAGAFALAWLIPLTPAIAWSALPSSDLPQLTALYAAITGALCLLFRRELSPWRYTSIPDALVLARICLLTVGVFLLAVFLANRAQMLPRSTLFMAPLFQMAGSMGVRVLRRALHRQLAGFQHIAVVGHLERGHLGPDPVRRCRHEPPGPGLRNPGRNVKS